MNQPAPPPFEITAAQIDRVVAVFYGAVRRHEILGPVFAGHIGDWPEHETLIASFWRNAILREGGYRGSPMRAHLMAGDVMAEHFPLWLALFDEALRRSLPAETAKAWSTLAHRIGAGLRMGLSRSQLNEPPILR